MSKFLESPLALRYWPVLHEDKKELPEPKKQRPVIGRPSRIGHRVLILDTETESDESQFLRFGSFMLTEGNTEKPIEGIFVADDLEDRDPLGYETARKYAEQKGLWFGTAWGFLNQVFFPETFKLGTLLVGFNLPFDISRLSYKWAECRGKNRGAFSLTFGDTVKYPRIRIRSIGPHASLIDFQSPKSPKKGERAYFAGRFVDLHTLVFALSGEGHTLLSAGKDFRAKILKHEQEQIHNGPITNAYLDYARNDVWATRSLYLALKAIYDDFPFASWECESRRSPDDTPITALFSPASLAKALFRKMNIKPNQAEIPPSYQGFAMAAFYGGRTECRIRRQETHVTLLDFSSQYPAVFTLLRLMPLLTADGFFVEEDSASVTDIMAEILNEPEKILQPETWPKLAGYALVLPQGDILPARVPFGASGKDQLSRVNVTVAPLESSDPMWYALPDLVASLLLTARVPTILRSFRVRPSMPQKELKAVCFAGVTLDPNDNALFAILINERKRLEKQGQQALASGFKLAASAGSYGTLLEFDDRNFEDKKKPHRATIYSETIFEHSFRGKWEKPGPYTNPAIGALITAGGRLLLAVLQWLVVKNGGSFAFTATDAMAVTGLSHGRIAEIQDALQALSPFDPVLVPKFLKIQANGIAFCVGPNRYCIKSAESGEIIKPSMHGMSGIIPPDGGRLKDFAPDLWRAALSGLIPTEWEREPLRRKFPIRKPATLDAIKDVCPALRPFNFLQEAATSKKHAHSGKQSPLFAPYSKANKRRQKWLHAGSGKLVTLAFAPEPSSIPSEGTAYPETLAEFASEYPFRKDIKSLDAEGQPCTEGTTGSISPCPIRRVGFYLIGKETDPIVQGDAETSPAEIERPELIVSPTPRRENRRTPKAQAPAVLEHVRKLSEWPASRVASLLGISDRQWRHIRDGKRGIGNQVIERIQAILQLLPSEIPPTFRERVAALDRIAKGKQE